MCLLNYKETGDNIQVFIGCLSSETKKHLIIVICLRPAKDAIGDADIICDVIRIVWVTLDCFLPMFTYVTILPVIFTPWRRNA